MGRRWGLDILRIASMAAVVLLHTAGQYWSRVDVFGADWEVLNFYDSLVRWAVPVFVMISGALFLDPGKDQPIKKLYSKNILRICTIIVFWGLIYAVLYGLPTELTWESVRGFIKTWIFGHYHMWFLFMIIGLYVVTPVLRCVTKDAMVTRYFLFLGFVLDIALPFVFSFGWLSSLSDLLAKLQFHIPVGYAFYFVLGYWLGQRKISARNRVAAGVLAILGVALTFVLTAYISLKGGQASEAFYGYFSLPVFMAAWGVFVLGKDARAEKKKAQRAISLLSKASLGVYMVHIIVLRTLHSAGIDSMMCSPVIAVPTTAGLVILISFLIAVMLTKVPIINRYCV